MLRHAPGPGLARSCPRPSTLCTGPGAAGLVNRRRHHPSSINTACLIWSPAKRRGLAALQSGPPSAALRSSALQQGRGRVRDDISAIEPSVPRSVQTPGDAPLGFPGARVLAPDQVNFSASPLGACSELAFLPPLCSPRTHPGLCAPRAALAPRAAPQPWRSVDRLLPFCGRF